METGLVPKIDYRFFDYTTIFGLGISQYIISVWFERNGRLQLPAMRAILAQASQCFKDDEFVGVSAKYEVERVGNGVTFLASYPYEAVVLLRKEVPRERRDNFFTWVIQNSSLLREGE